MQVDVHGIDAQVAGPDAANDGVEICAVAINITARCMHGVRNRPHVAFKQAARVGVGNHHASDVRAKAGFQRFEINTAFGCCWDILDIISGERCRSGVCTMRTFWAQDNRSGITARGQCGTDSQYPAKLAMRARFGRHRHRFHAGKRHEPMRKLVNNRKRALHSFHRLQRMHIRETSHPRDFFVQPRVVLHCAATQREETKVDGVILAAEAGVMAHCFWFGQTGQADIAVPFEITEARRDFGRFGEIDTGSAAIANLENQRFFKHQGFIAGIGRRLGFSSRTHFGLPATLVDRVHAKISCKAAANVSTSSAVVTSVTATTSPFSKPSAPG